MAIVEILRPPPQIKGEEGDGINTESISIPALAQISSNPDFVLVWNKNKKEAVTEDAFGRRSIFEYNLEEEGLLLQWDSCETSPELQVVKIWAPLEVLKRYSEILKLRLPMKQLKVESDDEDGRTTGQPSKSTSLSSLKNVNCLKDTVKDCWKGIVNVFTISLDPILFPKRSKKLTGVYSRDKEYLFDVDENNMDEIFPISTRARIVQYILRRKAYKTGEELDRDDFAFGYERLVKQKVYEAGYPLHDGSIHAKGSTRNLLWENWGKLSTFLKLQPLDTIKDYFGVNFAVYFAWLGYYTRMLVFAAIFGVACFVYGLASYSSDAYVQDICNKSSEITMCPMCDKSCGYWKLSEKCSYSKFAYLFDNDLTVLYALFMSVWAACFLEYWKRYSAKITHQWDLSGFDLKDFNPRPEYVAELKKIYPSGNKKPHEEQYKKDDEEENAEETTEKARFDFELQIPFWRRKLPFSLMSYSAVLFLVVLALTALIGVIMYRLWFSIFLSKDNYKDKGGFEWEGLLVSITAAFLNLSFIMIFGKVYERIAVKLTELEFPRTLPEFEASYTLKIFLLQFVNNYSSIFYVAFFKGAYAGAPHKYHKLFGVLRQEECGISCMPQLCIQLAVIMIGKQSKSMFNEAFVPWFRRIIKKVSRKCRVNTRTTTVEIEATPESRKASIQKQFIQWVKDYDLLEWGTFSLTDEYLEMVLQFGFVTIFVSAFPLAPFFALLNNIFELRIDAGKLLIHYRRPVGIRVKDIGMWTNIIDGIVKLAVVSNACIIALTSNFIPKLIYRYFLFDNTKQGYGTLDGYLKHSLTAYATGDLEVKPDPVVVERTGDSSVCYFPTYRNDYTHFHKYEFRTEHWQIWLARVIFVILYENIVGILIIFLRWLIPDVPRRLQKQIQREDRMVNELIVQQELVRSHKTWSAHHLLRPKSQSLQVVQAESRKASLEVK